MSWKELTIKLLVLAIDNNLSLYYSNKVISINISDEVIMFAYKKDDFNQDQLLKLLSKVKETTI